MKKLLKCLSVGFLSLSMLAGCASQDTPTNNETPSEQTWEDQLIKKGKISVGISPDYPPYESYNESGEIVGFDVDMMNEIAKLLGDYEIEWVTMSFDNIVSSIQLGQVDVGVAGFSYDPEREILFSTPYLKSSQVVLVSADSPIETIDDLNGKLVGVQLGTTGENAANTIEGATINAVPDAKLLVESLLSKSVDAVVIDAAVANNYVENGGYKLLSEPLVDEENGIVCATNHPLLMEKLNEVIEQFNNSDVQPQIKEKWGL